MHLYVKEVGSHLACLRYAFSMGTLVWEATQILLTRTLNLGKTIIIYGSYVQKEMVLLKNSNGDINHSVTEKNLGHL